MPDDQRHTIAFLGDPSTHGGAAVERHETHISLVFLAGERAYKLKRAVAYAYLDFSTAEKRRQACEAELALNRRTAPELYLEVRPIRRGPDGRVGWEADGDIVDWVVVMRRFRQERRLDAIGEAGELTLPLLHALAAHIAAFHDEAEQCRDHGGAAAMAELVRENDECLRGSRSVAFPDAQVRELREQSGEWVRRLAGLLDGRRAEGKVRRCHGDLHLRNICVLDGTPVLFDCLEFSEAFATIDVLYDLAFLLMDLGHQGHPDAANRVFNRYLDLTGEGDGLAAMPLFLSLRAAIRAHVMAIALKSDADASAAAEPRRYLDAAIAALKPSPPRLIAIGGLSGTGKSTIASKLAATLGALPGARVLRSDVIRKRLFGLDPEARLPESAYSAEMTSRVYETIRTQASAALRAGYCAIIDAVALRPEERQSFAEVARQAQAPFAGLWLTAPAEMLIARVAARLHDASDATREIVAQQLRADTGPLDWQLIHAGEDIDATLTAARDALGLA